MLRPLSCVIFVLVLPLPKSTAKKKVFQGMDDRNASSPIRLLVVNKEPIVVLGFQQLLSSVSDIIQVANCYDHKDLPRLQERYEPDVIVWDLDFCNENDESAAIKILEVNPNQKIIMFTQCLESLCVVKAAEIGLQGYVYRDTSPQDVLSSIRAVIEGKIHFDPSATTRLMQHMHQAHDNPVAPSLDIPLTHRELEVLTLLSDGLSNRDISKGLSIQERTVKFHVSAILQKLHARNRTEAAVLARQGHLLD